MSKSSFSLRNKAVKDAWNAEKQLILEGKGTRDWTVEQQKDILEKGRAYDDNGKAFEGQHMKSAEKYPEYQHDPKNIQFLTREEHLEAHDGNWQNPTNWYYDPILRTKTYFGDNPYIPCKIIELTEPIVLGSKDSSINQEKNDEIALNRQTTVTESNSIVSSKMCEKENPKADNQLSTKNRKNVFLRWICDNYKFILNIAEATSNILKIASNATYITCNIEKTTESLPKLNNPKSIINSNTDKKPYTPNDVGAHSQIYHTKCGDITKDVAPYHRGGNK